MPAARQDVLYAERIGIGGTITVGDILDLAGPGFLPPASLCDDADPAVLFYGHDQGTGAWTIIRATFSDGTLTRGRATSTGFPAYADLTAAWVDRAALTYT